MSNTWASGEEFTSAKANHVGTVWRRGRRTTVSSLATTTDVGVLRVDSIPIRALHSYLIKVYCHPDSTVTSDTLCVEVRYRDDGGAATTANSVLPDAVGFQKLGDAMYFEAHYSAALDQTLSLLLCVRRQTGTGNASLYADTSAAPRSTSLIVCAFGIDPGNTGNPV